MIGGEIFLNKYFEQVQFQDFYFYKYFYNQTETDDFDKINKGYDSLIKSVQKEMEEYQKKANNIKNVPKILEDIHYKYDQKILSIFHNPQAYNDYNAYYGKSYDLNSLIENNRLLNAENSLKDGYVLSKLKPGVIIKLKEIIKERDNELSTNMIGNDEIEELKDLNKKIQLCKNQIKTYEKEKQAAIIAKREEIRNNLLNNNVNNGVLTLYQDRHGFNQAVDNRIVNQIHQDYGNINN